MLRRVHRGFCVIHQMITQSVSGRPVLSSPTAQSDRLVQFGLRFWGLGQTLCPLVENGGGVTLFSG